MKPQVEFCQALGVEQKCVTSRDPMIKCRDKSSPIISGRLFHSLIL